jgi:sulfur-carrier protein
MRLLYFAWLRTRIGTAEEIVEPPASVATVASLIEWLKSRGPGFADALKTQRLVRVAVNKVLVGYDHPLQPGDEVGLFPPVTGG